VVEHGGELLGFGWKASPPGDAIVASAWTSIDAATWRLLDLAGTALAERCLHPFEAVVSGDGEIVVLCAIDLGSRATTLTSPDGRAWQEHPLELSLGEMETHLAVRPGVLLAAGGLSRVRTPLAWTSPDGHIWTAIDPPDGATLLTAITYDDANDEFVVAGSTADGLAIWFTDDGTTWSEPVTLSDGEGKISSLAALDGVILATGVTTSTPPSPSLAVWTLWRHALLHEQVLATDLDAIHGSDAIIAVGGGWAVIQADVPAGSWVAELAQPSVKAGP
jgi:hypothetical protein